MSAVRCDEVGAWTGGKRLSATETRTVIRAGEERTNKSSEGKRLTEPQIRNLLANRGRRGSVAPGLFREAAKCTLPSVWGAVAILCGLGIAFCWGCM